MYFSCWTKYFLKDYSHRFLHWFWTFNLNFPEEPHTFKYRKTYCGESQLLGGGFPACRKCPRCRNCWKSPRRPYREKPTNYFSHRTPFKRYDLSVLNYISFSQIFGTIWNFNSRPFRKWQKNIGPRGVKICSCLQLTVIGSKFHST